MRLSETANAVLGVNGSLISQVKGSQLTFLCALFRGQTLLLSAWCVRGAVSGRVAQCLSQLPAALRLPGLREGKDAVLLICAGAAQELYCAISSLLNPGRPVIASRVDTNVQFLEHQPRHLFSGRGSKVHREFGTRD